MTVNDLINKLKGFPTDMKVVVRGYEGGFDDIAIVESITLKLNVNTEWYYGPHGKSDDKEGIMAVLLNAAERKY